MAGRRDVSVSSVRNLRDELGALRGFESSTTSMARLSRRKPWMKRAGCWRLSWVAMSFWTVRSGGGGEGDDGGGAEGGKVFAEGAVVGAEIVAPGGDAVGFVDGDERRLAAGEHLREARDAHALGSDEEELEVAVEVVAAGLAGVVAGEAGVDAGDAETGGGELRWPGRP